MTCLPLKQEQSLEFKPQYYQGGKRRLYNLNNMEKKQAQYKRTYTIQIMYRKNITRKFVRGLIFFIIFSEVFPSTAYISKIKNIKFKKQI
jgi:hypothetical protein